ncbi:ABC transporter permease [Massilibacteroides sp.]|uniref:ABC transporter permease n=1 Tax=Massilibacteroides sp. TaxID=2034766 RepID=UPI002620A941|nr:ABC transporter permease [Massilibacteroides sp.]MDD4514295.1 ABC transporter permease [Massilibacteroides sp.]
MKTILRNFIYVLRRFKMATILNILGLSIAFAAFLIIMMQVGYDQNFDASHPNADRIFRVELVNEGTKQAIIARPFAEKIIASSPHVKEGAILNTGGDRTDVSVLKDGQKQFYKEKMRTVSPSLPRVFGFEMLEGDVNSLEEPESALIPESLAHKLFPGESGLGKQIFMKYGEVTVKGVYKDMAKNSSLSNAIYCAMNPKENATNWGNWNYEFYLLLDDPSSAREVHETFTKNFDPQTVFGEGANWDLLNIRFTPLRDLHYTTDVTYDYTPKSTRQIVMVLFAIALLIIVIGGINFTNFSTALTPMRIKSINTQKVLGGTNRMLRTALLIEAVCVTFTSFLIALGLVTLFSASSLSELVSADTSLLLHKELVLIAAVISLALGIVAGLYPAFYVTSFSPALVLKGSFGLSPKGRLLRNGLIGIQFFASFALISGALFMYLQNQFMHNSPLGYNKDELIVCNFSNPLLESWDAVTSELKSFSGIENVSNAQSLLSSGDQYMGWGRKYKGEDINYQCLPVDPTFLDVIGVKVTEGRNFRKEDVLTRHGAYVFNETARFKYNLELNSMIDSAEIIGFIPDIKFASFRTEVSPMAFYVWGTQNWGTIPSYLYVKVKAGTDLRAAMQHVKATVHKFDEETLFDAFFYDKVLDNLYKAEDRLTQQITLFSLVAVFISIVGVFGLVVFDCEYRKKEIGLRKVMGSTVGMILSMFNLTYLKILGICFVLSLPVTWYLIHAWLESFVYKTPMYWWVFLVAFLVVSLITMATVSFQSWKAANENPVNSIKTE